MESIIRNVRDIEADKRQWLESTLGHELLDNQQIIIRVLTPGVAKDPETRDLALEEASRIAAHGRANAAAQGIDDEEVGKAVNEAIEHVRTENT